MKRRIYEILELDPPILKAARVARALLLALIVVSVLGLVLESVDRINRAARPALRFFEFLTIAAFTVEYLARLWSITEDARYAHPVRGRLRWIVSPLALIDLLAILPFYLPFIVADLRVLRLARIFRLARIARLSRYSKAAAMMAATARARREELSVSVSFIGILLLIASSLMYYAENEAQPDVFSSIPATMWWAIVTLTTVGYGDAVPITPLGRMLSAITAILGIAMLALPTAILSAGFMERMQQNRKQEKSGTGPGLSHCPHCGGELLHGGENHDLHEDSLRNGPGNGGNSSERP